MAVLFIFPEDGDGIDIPPQGITLPPPPPPLGDMSEEDERLWFEELFTPKLADEDEGYYCEDAAELMLRLTGYL